jgi:2C-methyl-D-erythritol 2,4-cyclodiphosphate synthase
VPGSIALSPRPCDGSTGRAQESDLDALVKSVTDAVMGALDAK